MKPKSGRSMTDVQLTRITNWLAGIALLALLLWGGRILWLRIRYTYTNDAQVTQYINPIIPVWVVTLFRFTLKIINR